MLMLSVFSFPTLCCPIFVRAMQTPDPAEAFRAKFMKETDPVRKAKILIPLGDAEFRDIQKEAGADNAEGALAILRQYRDEADASQKALEATGHDPEKHPNGFKELQMSLRESLRRLDNVIGDLSGDEQKPFLDIRQELDQMDRRLIHELFPRRPESDREPQPDKPKS
ncbi:MAG: hypothetical protein WCD49_15695 [Candidatus Acidiferrales bacterium]